MGKKKTFSEYETYADRLAWHSCRGSGGGGEMVECVQKVKGDSSI